MKQPTKESFKINVASKKPAVELHLPPRILPEQQQQPLLRLQGQRGVPPGAKPCGAKVGTPGVAVGSMEKLRWPKKAWAKPSNAIVGRYFNLRKIQQTPGTDPRYPKIQIWRDFLHKQVVEGLGYVPGVCWSFLRFKQFEILKQKRVFHVSTTCSFICIYVYIWK